MNSRIGQAGKIKKIKKQKQKTFTAEDAEDAEVVVVGREHATAYANLGVLSVLSFIRFFGET